jgi:hypothetical protein
VGVVCGGADDAGDPGKGGGDVVDRDAGDHPGG